MCHALKTSVPNHSGILFSFLRRSHLQLQSSFKWFLNCWVLNRLLSSEHYAHVTIDSSINVILSQTDAAAAAAKSLQVVSDSVRPHRRQPTRLRHPWDSPGKNTGEGCHFLLQCIKVKSESEVPQTSDIFCL